jgi:SpoVK/Ycf46/Vps4 family AAA+-type ATPase
VQRLNENMYRSIRTQKDVDNHAQELKIHMRHFEEAMKKIRPLSAQLKS